MSIDIMNRIWWRQDLSMTEKFVALAIADAASDDGVCWPAVATLAVKCSCSPRSVQNATKALCAKGLLRKRERPDQSSYYIFVLDVLPLVERPRRVKEQHPVDYADRQRESGQQGTGAGDSPQLFDTGESLSMTGESLSMTGAGDSPRTINEPSIETSDSDSGDFKSPAVSEKGDLIAFVEAEWHQLKAEFPGIADIRKVDESLAKQIQLRARQHAAEGEDGFAVWRTVFEQIRASTFLTGRAPPGRDRDAPFKLSLGWLCGVTKFREVINGKYSSERGNNRHVDPATGRAMGPTGQAVSGTIERLRAARERCA